MRADAKIFILTVMLTAVTAGNVFAQFDYAARATPGSLSFTFIGNTAFAITDGEMTLMIDYPYAPGNYMGYDFFATKPTGFGVCLISHGHKDHFVFGAFIKHSWALIGPPSVVDPVKGYETMQAVDGEPVEFEGLHVLPIATPHGNMEHNSYLVTWHGVRMYFSGDTEVDNALLAAQDLDVAFVTPWLLDVVRQAGGTINARRVIVYHHVADQDVVDYADRLVPTQGATFEIDYREPASTSQ